MGGQRPQSSSFVTMDAMQVLVFDLMRAKGLEVVPFVSVPPLSGLARAPREDGRGWSPVRRSVERSESGRITIMAP